jgi:predicted phage terminase large subunit-like protein
LLPSIARARLAKLKAQASTSQIGLVDYVTELCPTFARFDYFQPYADDLERAIGSDLRLCFAAPPQHGKTEFTLRALLWIARFHPGFRHAYVTYNQTRARDVSKDFQRIAEDAGFTVSGTLDSIELNWNGKTSKVKFSSIDSSLTGYTIDGVCVVDDYIKGPKEARSKANREAGIRWWQSVARTRRHPGTSYIVMATRWPGGDLTEHLIKKEGWKYINLKAIAAGPVNENGVVIDDPLGRKAGESLAPWKPPEFFSEDQKNLYWWNAMFQGDPRTAGLRVFAEVGSVNEDNGEPMGPRYYRELPKDGYRVAFGVDLAYTAKTSADWSVCIEGWESGGKLYIVNVIRKQVDAPSFLLTLITCKANRPGARFRFYASGTEKGGAQFIQRKIGPVFKVVTASADKLVRATPASATWNCGNVLLPDPDAIDAPWLDEFLAVVCGFSGTPGETDDDVDAFAALHDQLIQKSRMFEALTKAAGKS